MSIELASYIRDVPDFPKPGILFKDITPLLSAPEAFQKVTSEFADAFRELAPTKIVGIESRGFIFGAPLAHAMDIGMVLVRKPGKLPAATYAKTYELEYGTDTLEIHQDAITAEDRVLIVDDLLATGGTASATGELIQEIGGQLVGYAFVIELAFLKGREKLGDSKIVSLLTY